ncbi:MAG: YybH family protein [Gemmatimonadaceae bacterium]
MKTPLDTINRLVSAINAGDLATAVALYEPDAILVVQPGHRARGTSQVREALGSFVAMQATLHFHVWPEVPCPCYA